MAVIEGRPAPVRLEAMTPLPMWPITLMITAYPLWFVLGLSGFSWVALSVPMAAALVHKRDLVVPRGSGWWVLFLVAVTGSVASIDTLARMSGWLLRYGYYIAAAVVLIYVLNGRRGFTVWDVVRAFTYLWMAAVAGGYLAFVLGDLSFRSPTAYLMPAVLLENDLIAAMVIPSFADLQDIIGVPIPRPKAPFPYTNTWGSMLGLLTPFAVVAWREPRVGLSPRLVKALLAASIVPAVVSLNRGLWLSLGIGLLYAAIRFGAAGASRVVRNGAVAALVFVVVLTLTPLGDLATTRVATGHSDADRIELITDAVDGAAERPLFGWGAPRPNDRNLPSIGTHGQMWFALFSYGFLGALGYFGFMASLTWHTRRQPTPSGVWLHTVLIIGLVQTPYYLHVPHQLFTMFVAAALAIRLQREATGSG